MPISSGIAGYVVTSGKPLRIDEAYLDPRFNRAEEVGTHDRTKTILAVPIKDSTGRIIGIFGYNV